MFTLQAIKADTLQHPQIDQFIPYFETTWLIGNFPVGEWNAHDTDSVRRNNDVEGWHSRLKRIVGKPHPNILECVQVFQREQAATEIAIIAIPSRRTKRADQKIKLLKERFVNNLIFLQDYVIGMSAHTNI